MFDEEPDRDPHGECRAEIHRLTALRCDCDEESGRHAPTCVVMVREQNVAMAAEIARLRAAAEEREADMHARIRAGYDKTVADAWRAEVAKRDAEIARLTAELDVARAEVNCGQDGPCAKAPGCARHWQERNRELVAELAAARAVTVDVCRYLDCSESDLLAVVTSLYETRARAISDATAAHGTVGGLLAAGEERESRAWSEKGKAPPGSCPFCASRISMVQRDGYFIARCSHRGCGAVGPRMRSVSRAADLFCQPPRREAQGMSCGPIVASPPRPRCSCTHEAGDSRCNVHPTCSECGASTTRPVDEVRALRAELAAAREAAQRDRDVAQAMAKAAHEAEEELAAARAVPAEVEVAIGLVDAIVEHVRTLDSYDWQSRLDDSRTSDDAKDDARELSHALRDYDRSNGSTFLRTAIARAISDATDKRDAEWQKRIAPLHPNRTGDGCDSGDPIDWTFAALMLARIDVESDAHDEGHRAAMRDATAARGTVGGLLATAPVGSIVECSFMRSHRQVRATGFESIEQRWYADGAWSDWYSLSYQFIAFQLPARLVPAAEADVDPSQRGPLAATATNLHPDGCHTADPTAPRDCTSDGHHECTSCARFDAAGRAAMGDDPIGGPHGPLPKGG